jgi:hypothetical protein
LEQQRADGIAYINSALSNLDDDYERDRISRNLGLDSEEDIANLRQRLNDSKSWLEKISFTDFTLENLQKYGPDFYRKASSSAITKDMNISLYGDPSTKTPPTAAFKFSNDNSGRVWIVSRNYFGAGRGARDKARTLVHEASHFTGTDDRSSVGFNNAHTLSKWIVMRPKGN